MHVQTFISTDRQDGIKTQAEIEHLYFYLQNRKNLIILIIYLLQVQT